MTRRSAVRKLQRILSYWEGCQLNEKAASEILEQIEKEIGMKPPKIYGGGCMCTMRESCSSCSGYSDDLYKWEEK